MYAEILPFFDPYLCVYVAYVGSKGYFIPGFKERKSQNKRNFKIARFVQIQQKKHTLICHSFPKMLLLTKLSVSGSSQKKGFPSFSCFLTKFSISTSKLADVVPSEPCVDCSHFSNNSANKGNSGCLGIKDEQTVRLEIVSQHDKTCII